MPSHKFDGFTPIESDHMDGAKYDSMNRRMTIRYQNGYQYEVHGVSPEHYQEFMDAPSQGEHYHQHIRDNFHVERVK
jgi:KTSC domain-containing protein